MTGPWRKRIRAGNWPRNACRMLPNALRELLETIESGALA